MTVAILCVDRNSIYKTMPDVEAYDQTTYRPHYDQHQPGIVSGYEAMTYPHPLCPKLDALGLPWFATDDGSCLLINGDCLKVLPLLEAGLSLAILTDPPYGLGIAANPVRQAHDKMDLDNSPASWEHINAMLALGVPSIIWGGNYFPMPPAKCILCWDKVQPEDFSLAMCEYAWTNIDTPSKLYRRMVVGYEKLHPTQKPVELIEWCFGRYLVLPETILDPFAGSATTAIACLRTGRRFIGIELEPRYYAIACDRITKEIKRTELLEKPPQIVQRSFLEERGQ